MRFILILSLALAGCLPKLDDGGVVTVCTASALPDSLQITAEFEDILPKYLAFAFNGEELDHDECATDQLHPYRYHISRPDSKTARAYLSWDGEDGDFTSLFDENRIPLAGKTASIVIYGRADCEDEPTEILRKENIQIQWNDPRDDQCLGGTWQGTAKVE